MKLALSALKMAKIGCCRSSEAVLVVESNGSNDQPPKRESRASPQCRSTASLDINAYAANEKGKVGGSSVNDDLIDVYPLAIGFLSPGEVARLLPLCHTLHAVGKEALPSVLANDLRPILPVSLVKAIDDSADCNDRWMKLAKEWRRKSFQRAGTGSGGTEDDSRRRADNNLLDVFRLRTSRTTNGSSMAYTDNLLEVFLTKPEVSKFLVHGCDPAAFVSYLRALGEGYTSLGDLWYTLDRPWNDDEMNDDDGPYKKLTETGVPNAGVRADGFFSFVREVFKYAPGDNHYFCIEITAEGGKPICLEDGTPMVMWVNGEGRVVSPRTSSVIINPKNEEAIEKLRQEIAQPCSCCGYCNETEPFIGDESKLWSNLLLLDEPYLANEYVGCEKECYGRIAIDEDDLDGLAFGHSVDDTFTGIAPEDSEFHACGFPDVDSLDNLFEVTLKVVRFDHDNGPSSVTVLDKAPLEMYQRSDCMEGRHAGASAYMLQTSADDTDAGIVLDVIFHNSAKLVDFSSETFECVSRPKSNQLWLTNWGIDIMKVDTLNHPEAWTLARSELFWRCGLLDGFD